MSESQIHVIMGLLKKIRMLIDSIYPGYSSFVVANENGLFHNSYLWFVSYCLKRVKKT